MEKLIKALQSDYPRLTFVVGPNLCWSPGKQEIYYNPSGRIESMFGVLHEIGHARLGHHTYLTDVDLLQKEVLAWQEALRLAASYGVKLQEAHVQDCLDTYRDWIYRRSVCPGCSAAGVQDKDTRYVCLNCGNTWTVSKSRFCRPYRSHDKSQA